MLIYLDANVVIYLIERPPGFGPRALARVTALLAAGDKIVVSDLTRLECRSKPLGAGDTATLADYDQFFATAVERVVLLTTAVCDRATARSGGASASAPRTPCTSPPRSSPAAIRS